MFAYIIINNKSETMNNLIKRTMSISNGWLISKNVSNKVR